MISREKMGELNEVIEHYKRHINRATENNDNNKLMKCIMKLSRLPITVQNLQKTGIGRVVNSLRKYDGDIGESAKTLVIQWKNVVKIEESENFYQRDDNSDEEHEDMSPTNDNEELQITQNITSSVASTSYYNNNANETEFSDEHNGDSSDYAPTHYQHHEKSKNKKSKKEKDNKKRKESTSNLPDFQEVSKKIKKEHKSDSSKIKNETEKCVIATTSRQENDKHSEENIKKEKKSSHSDKKKDKYKSSHKSESKSHRDKHESKSAHKDHKSDSKKKTKDKIKEESKPSTSTTCGSSSSKTFEEALLGIGTDRKKIKSKSRDKLSRSSSSDRDSSPDPTHMKLAPLNLDPEELIANYKPLPQFDVRKRKTIEDIDPLASIMTTKNMRTKVYSGNKSTIYTEVPRLIDLCVQIIKDNLAALEYTGGVPFMILEPILKYCTPDQLYNFEGYNPYLIDDTDVLWEYHCKKEFRNKVPNKNESWRDFYIRSLEERETKLAKLRQNINANQAASTPVRKTQLAYVDTAVKPPRGVARKQAKFQTHTDTKRNILNKSMMGGNSTSEALTTNNRSTTMATGVPVSLTSAHTPSSASLKKKKAPLMQKALQLIKSTRRR